MIRALFATLLHPVFHARDVLERVAGAVGNLRDLVREAMVFGTDKDGNVTRSVRVEHDGVLYELHRMRLALEEVADAGRRLTLIGRTVVVASAPGDLCGGTGKKYGTGLPCEGCRACA